MSTKTPLRGGGAAVASGYGAEDRTHSHSERAIFVNDGETRAVDTAGDETNAASASSSPGSGRTFGNFFHTTTLTKAAAVAVLALTGILLLVAAAVDVDRGSAVAASAAGLDPQSIASLGESLEEMHARWVEQAGVNRRVAREAAREPRARDAAARAPAAKSETIATAALPPPPPPPASNPPPPPPASDAAIDTATIGTAAFASNGCRERLRRMSRGAVHAGDVVVIPEDIAVYGVMVKSASESIRTKLEEDFGVNWKQPILGSIGPPPPPGGVRQKSHLLTPEIVRDYTFFTFVRDPATRFRSSYAQAMVGLYTFNAVDP